MRRMTRLLVFGAGVAVGMTLIVPPEAPAAPIRECGDLPSSFAYNITTRKVFCGKARRVVRRWGETAARQEGGDGQVFDLYCNYRNTGYESGDIRCTGPRGRVVHWQTSS